MTPHQEERPEPGTGCEAQCETAQGIAGESYGREQRKRFATLQAAAALAGIVVTPIEADNGQRVYILSKGSLSKECSSLDEVRALLVRMGVVVPA